ncbi:hypothetical protein D3C75_255060 [compost metagenome]
MDIRQLEQNDFVKKAEQQTVIIFPVHLVRQLERDFGTGPAETAEGLLVRHIVGVRPPAAVAVVPAVILDIFCAARACIRAAVLRHAVQLRSAVAGLRINLRAIFQSIESLHHHPLIHEEWQRLEVSAVQIGLVKKILKPLHQIPEHEILHLFE